MLEWYEGHEAQMKKLLTENERLRGALRQFVSACDTASPVSLMTEIGMACEAAREALK